MSGRCFEDLELERANHSATPCAVERKDEGHARSDENRRESQCEQGPTHTKHKWNDMGDGDGRDGPQMASDDVKDSQALARGDISA